MQGRTIPFEPQKQIIKDKKKDSAIWHWQD